MHRTPPRRVPRVIAVLGFSLVLHVLVLAGIAPYWDELTRRGREPLSRPVPLTVLPEPLPEPEPPPPPPQPPLPTSGQIVDLPPPLDEEQPISAEYLAEHARIVEEETRSRRYRVNPEVLAESYSRDDRLQFEDVIDVNATEPSTGAQVGNHRFDPDRNGRLAALPSPFALTNKDGMDKPVPASSTESRLAGAPNNDRLDEKAGDATRLNTYAYLYAPYMNRIRRLVVFYWMQNVQNIPSSEPLTKSEYVTVVDAVLDGSGALQSVIVRTASGSEVVDSCLVEAFRLAGPFPPPPKQLIQEDGRVYLPSFDVTLDVGHAQAPYTGVDPRSNVRFPGILKADQ